MNPMAPRVQQEIFDATLRLVAEKGYGGLTVEGVAELSGVDKTTIYRWWPSKAALLGAALVEADLAAEAVATVLDGAAAVPGQVTSASAAGMRSRTVRGTRP